MQRNDQPERPPQGGWLTMPSCTLLQGKTFRPYRSLLDDHRDAKTVQRGLEAAMTEIVAEAAGGVS